MEWSGFRKKFLLRRPQWILSQHEANGRGERLYRQGTRMNELYIQYNSLLPCSPFTSYLTLPLLCQRRVLMQIIVLSESILLQNNRERLFTRHQVCWPLPSQDAVTSVFVQAAVFIINRTNPLNILRVSARAWLAVYLLKPFFSNRCVLVLLWRGKTIHYCVRVPFCHTSMRTFRHARSLHVTQPIFLLLLRSFFFSKT